MFYIPDIVLEKFGRPEIVFGKSGIEIGFFELAVYTWLNC